LKVVEDLHVGIERRVFWKVADASSDFERLIGDIVTVNFDDAARGRHVAGNHPHCGCFAGAVGTEKAEDLALFNLERYPVDRGLGGVALGQILNRNHSGSTSCTGLMTLEIRYSSPTMSYTH